MRYPTQINRLVECFKRLPGVGRKSAERIVFYLISQDSEKLFEMSSAISEIPLKLAYCERCGSIIEKQCSFCIPARMITKMLCIVAYPKDVYALEETRTYQGVYHVLGGLLSPLEGIEPDKLQLNEIRARIKNESIQEVILALDSTLEGDATAHYLKQELEKENLKISRLAFGLPMGSSFEYIDGGTLARAFSGRSIL